MSANSCPSNSNKTYGFCKPTLNKNYQNHLSAAYGQAQNWRFSNQLSETVNDDQPNWSSQAPNSINNIQNSWREPNQSEHIHSARDSNQIATQKGPINNQCTSNASYQVKPEEETQTKLIRATSDDNSSAETNQTRSNFVVFDQPSSETRKSRWATTEASTSQTNSSQVNKSQTTQVEEYNYHDLETAATSHQVKKPVELDIKMYDLENATQGDPSLREHLYGDSIYAASSFEELNLKQELLKGIYAMNFNKPSKIQEQALPALLQDPPSNIICQSQSGNGKSAAFVLTMLQRCDADIKAPQSICLAPTRELARQLDDVIKKMAQFTKITHALVIKEATIKNSAITEHIVVGTPGSMMHVLNRHHLNTSHIRTFVLDEADNMLEEGLGDQSTRVKNLIAAKEFQIMLFSATFPSRIMKFAKRFAPNARELLLKGEKAVTKNITQLYMDCENLEHKYEVLCNLYDLLRVSQSIIFCRTRETAARISDRMTEQGHKVKYLHAGLSPEERDAVIDEFRKGEFKVLISTNVVSRGIDIAQISLVINYDTPLNSAGEPDMDVYIHRIGRTGRFGRKGTSICFAHDNETWKQINTMERLLGVTITRVGTENWEETEKQFKSLLY